YGLSQKARDKVLRFTSPSPMVVARRKLARVLLSPGRQFFGFLIQPANRIPFPRRREEIVEFHVPRGKTGICPFGSADATAIEPHPLFFGVGNQIGVGE